MSRDGWLPPGVTDADIDRAAPGYYAEWCEGCGEQVCSCEPSDEPHDDCAHSWTQYGGGRCYCEFCGADGDVPGVTDAPGYYAEWCEGCGEQVCSCEPSDSMAAIISADKQQA